MARVDQSEDWRDRHSPSISTFESLAMEAYSHLPDEFRSLTGNLVILIEDFPDDEVFEDMALETPFDLLGLFEGRGISERFTAQTGDMPNKIRLYRRPIIDYWAENDETLGDIITHVLIHEIGHHFGLSDEDMERIEASAEEATDRRYQPRPQDGRGEAKNFSPCLLLGELHIRIVILAGHFLHDGLAALHLIGRGIEGVGRRAR